MFSFSSSSVCLELLQGWPSSHWSGRAGRDSATGNSHPTHTHTHTAHSNCSAEWLSLEWGLPCHTKIYMFSCKGPVYHVMEMWLLLLWAHTCENTLKVCACAEWDLMGGWLLWTTHPDAWWQRSHLETHCHCTHAHTHTCKALMETRDNKFLSGEPEGYCVPSPPPSCQCSVIHPCKWGRQGDVIGAC